MQICTCEHKFLFYSAPACFYYSVRPTGSGALKTLFHIVILPQTSRKFKFYVPSVFEKFRLNDILKVYGIKFLFNIRRNIIMELLLSCLPGIISGIFLFIFQHKLNKRERIEKESDETRNKYIKLIVDLTLATHALSEATAVALQTGRNDGEISRAVEYARDIKYRHRDFLEVNGINNIF